jgi:hypothetical protein
MKIPSLVLLLLTCITLLPAGQTARRINAGASQKPVQKDLESLLQKEFGEHVKLTQLEPSNYASGDFNGDGFKDFAVMVEIENAKSELAERDVKVFDTDPYSKTNGSVLDPLMLDIRNCAGLAIFQGTAAGWEKPGAKFLTYTCFSSVSLLAKAQAPAVASKTKKRMPRLVGDGLKIEEENGAQTLIYWDGKVYRGANLSGGD